MTFALDGTSFEIACGLMVRAYISVQVGVKVRARDKRFFCL